MDIQIQSVSDLGEIKTLLQTCNLPVDDLDPARPLLPIFFGIYDSKVLTAVIGLEIYGSVGLLRSLAVMPKLRRHGLGRALAGFAEVYAANRGVDRLYLLTTSAADFFSTLGYAQLNRDSAPPAIRNTAQYSTLCPASSAFMCKLLADRPAKIAE